VDRVRLAGLAMNAAYGGVGAVVSGPADSWNTAYFAAAGRLFDSTTLNPDRGLYRLTVTSRGEVLISDNLMRHPGGPPPQHGRVALCQSRLPRTRTVYLSVQDDTMVAGNLQGFFVGGFRSDDFGGHWTPLPAMNAIVNADGGGQTAYDLIIAVDPQQSWRVYAAQQQLWRSLTSGSAWPVVNPVTAGGVDQLPHGRSPSTTLLHWDHHELVFAPPTWWDWNGADPVLPTPAYHGTDGGIARSGGVGDGPMTFTQLNEGIATSLLTSLDIGRGAGHTEVTFAGLQDTGVAGHRTGDSTGVWTEGFDGDGDAVGVDPADPDIVFAFSNGNLLRSTNGGQTWFMANEPGGATVEIIRVTNTNPVQVTTSGHPFRTGDVVSITGVPGGGGLANGGATITVPPGDTRTFTLNGKNGAAVAAFGPFPVVIGDRYLTQHDIVAATLEAPIQIETATPHGCVTGQTVRIDAVEGNTAANNSDARPVWTVTVISLTRFSLDGSDGTLSPPYVPHTGRLRGPAVNGPVPVFGTTNANPAPIVVTAQGHGFVTGGLVTITGVTGNTAANVAGQAITVLDANSFALNGVAGNGAPHGMPRVRGGSIGRGLPAGAYIARVALVPNPAGPSTKIFVSMDRGVFRSTNGGITFVQMSNFADFISALHAPADHRLWVGESGLQNTNRVYRVRFSATDGASYDPGVTADVGARSFISQIIEDPRDATGQRVAVVCAGYSRTVTSRRTRHVFLTTTQGRAAGGVVPWHEVGGVFDAASGNLPDVPVTGAAWIPPPPPAGAADPSDLLIASDSGVLRLDLAGPRWARVGPNLPKVGVQAIAADPGGGTPVIRVGTYGRSAWEFTVPAGPSLYVQADLGFGDQQVGTTVRLPMVLHSVGAGDLQITGIDGMTGDVTVESVPAGTTAPFPLASGTRQPFDVVFTPSAPGDRGAFLTISSDDPDFPAVEVKVTGFGVAAGAPRLSVRAFLEFGVVPTAAPATLDLELRNIGDGPLQIDTLAPDPHGSPTFTLPAPPALPLPIPPGGSTTVTVQFAPVANGVVRSALTITGSGQGQVVTLTGQGTTTAAGLVADLFEQFGIGQPVDAIV
jgi:HYDIN/CFA65/VesB-like, Ig-like domain